MSFLSGKSEKQAELALMPKIKGSTVPNFKSLVLLKSLKNALLLIHIMYLNEQSLINFGSMSNVGED